MVGVVQISFHNIQKGRIIALLNVMAIWSRLTGIRLSRCAAKIWQVHGSSFGQYLQLSSTIRQERESPTNDDLVKLTLWR